ncbi:Protein FRIGIDA [Vitis vinifera]|uniref:FRIGIDA-like protein n=1 Tax=Vitis vinifera TaxID=29760 RepID=A0A438HBZ9_VITVI|nr:Protein FRIGIDA [Vitis vinifera]
MAKTSMTLTVKEGQPPPPLCAAAVSGESGGGDPMRSVNELRNLSTVLHAFRRRWDELQKHLDFIQDAIASRTNASATSVSELGFLCGMMRSRGLRKYIISHLSDVAKLREEVPAALKGAPKPAKLVLECIGRFFLQGSKAFGKATHMVPSRQASLLILEFFLLSDCTEMEPIREGEADLAAVTWRKRLINEGGVSNASDIDARGLLLLVASFGIPALFRNEDLRNLIRLSCPKEISDVLRRSRFLLARVPGVEVSPPGIRFRVTSLRKCLEGLEECCREERKGRLVKVWEEEGRKFRVERRENGVGRYILCSVVDVETKRFCLVVPEGKSLLGGWAIFAEKLWDLGVVTQEEVKFEEALRVESKSKAVIVEGKDERSLERRWRVRKKSLWMWLRSWLEGKEMLYGFRLGRGLRNREED